MESFHPCRAPRHCKSRKQTSCRDPRLHCLQALLSTKLTPPRYSRSHALIVPPPPPTLLARPPQTSVGERGLKVRRVACRGADTRPALFTAVARRVAVNTGGRMSLGRNNAAADTRRLGGRRQKVGGRRTRRSRGGGRRRNGTERAAVPVQPFVPNGLEQISPLICG